MVYRVVHLSVTALKHVDPAAAIQQGKAASEEDFIIAMLKPR